VAAFALAASIAVLPAPERAAAAQSPSEVHVRAVAAARAGRHEEAVSALAALTAEFPQEARYLHDYVVVLGWAGRDAEALALLPRVDLGRAPAYVLEGVARSARGTGDAALAVRILRPAVERFPERLESRLSLGRALADAGQHAEATRVLQDAQARFGDSVALLLAQAYAAETRGDYFDALALYQSALERDPANREAQRGGILMAARVHASVRALELAAVNPEILRADERAALEADATAARIRWGAIHAARNPGPERFAETDAALQATDPLARVGTDGRPLSAPERALLFDRIVALKDRFRMADAVALYERLLALGLTVPAYARLAVAEALLYLERPERAGELYRGVLAEQPESFDAALGLFYALVETERHAEAAEAIDRLVARTPRLLYAGDPLMERPNPQYQTAAAARSMAPAYADLLQQAEAETAALVLQAPFSMPLRENAASVAILRGWPRRGEEELQWVLAAEPDNGIADAQRVSPLLEMHDFREAERALGHGLRTAAEDKRVRVAEDRWAVHNLRELYVDATVGRSSGGAPTGTHDYTIDAWLYSTPIAYDWRAFAHAHLAGARFPEGPVDWRRFGAGVEHRRRDLLLTAELSAGAGDGAAVALGARWWANDRLSVFGSAQTESTAVPLQARRSGIGGRGAELAATYRVHESRTFAAGVRALDFSDGNLRTGASLAWSERLVTGPVYKLDLLLAADASRNSREDAPYFNPSSDFTPSLTLANDWLTWRRYARSFRQRLSLTLGSYRQSGFGAGGVWGVQYEHVWEVDRRLYLRYGLGRDAHPYDGARTTRDYALLTLGWRF
jgi:biofilm PGA synthesis protein PgaA